MDKEELQEVVPLIPHCEAKSAAGGGASTTGAASAARHLTQLQPELSFQRLVKMNSQTDLGLHLI